jgi:hypothetical protein
MTLDQARELRQELEAVEDVMQRIKTLWGSGYFPTHDALHDRLSALRDIESAVNRINERAGHLPSADKLRS